MEGKKPQQKESRGRRPQYSTDFIFSRTLSCLSVDVFELLGFQQQI